MNNWWFYRWQLSLFLPGRDEMEFPRSWSHQSWLKINDTMKNYCAIKTRRGKKIFFFGIAFSVRPRFVFHFRLIWTQQSSGYGKLNVLIGSFKCIICLFVFLSFSMVNVELIINSNCSILWIQRKIEMSWTSPTIQLPSAIICVGGAIKHINNWSVCCLVKPFDST